MLPVLCCCGLCCWAKKGYNVPRTNTELVSRLPYYEAKRSKDFPKWLIVTCTRADCELPFMVREKEWLQPFYTRPTDPKKKPSLIEGRSCPYCFRPSRLPSRRKIQ